jgi:hypothetical protein
MKTGYQKVYDKRLGRYISQTDEHLKKYPFAAIYALLAPTPVVPGVNWYSNFDRPVKDKKDGKWWVGKDDLGYIRGGHCICCPPDDNEPYSWYLWYNQLSEGKCVGEGIARAGSWFNRKMYIPDFTWNEAKIIDEWDDTNPGDNNGTSVNAGFKVWKAQGLQLKAKGVISLTDGIASYRWAQSFDDMLTALKNPLYNKLGAVPFVNSWGKDYPRKVWMPGEVWERLIKEDGEFGIPTDK